MDEYRDTSMHGTEDEKNPARVDMNDNTAPETGDAAETEILSAVSDIDPDEDGTENDTDAGETKDGTGPVWQRRNHRRRNVVIASVIAAVVVLAGGAGGYAYAASNVQKGVDAAHANAQSVDQKLTAKVAEAQELFDGTEEGQVADVQTLTALSDAIDKAQAQSGVAAAGANRWLVWEEMDAQTAYNADAKDAEDAMGRLDKAMDAVTGSVDAKNHSDARAALQSTVDSADKTYTDSDGKVQDNATRDSLKTALDAAKKVLDDNSVTDAKEYTDQKTAVDNAVKTVNDSVTAKEKADADAKAKAEAEAAAAASSAASSGGYSGGGSYYGGSTGSSPAPSYNGGGSSASSGGTGQSGSSPTYEWWNDYDSMGNPTTPLEGDGWSQDIF